MGVQMKRVVASQKGTGGTSAKINYATGSGSRPKGGSKTIPTSAPKSAQKIR